MQTKVEFYKTHENKNRENEWELFMNKVRYALKKIGDDYCEFLTMHNSNNALDETTVRDVLNASGSFSYNEGGVALDFEFDRCIYAAVED